MRIFHCLLQVWPGQEASYAVEGASYSKKIKVYITHNHEKNFTLLVFVGTDGDQWQPVEGPALHHPMEFSHSR
jgi:hypothetical protein